MNIYEEEELYENTNTKKNLSYVKVTDINYDSKRIDNCRNPQIKVVVDVNESGRRQSVSDNHVLAKYDNFKLYEFRNLGLSK